MTRPERIEAVLQYFLKNLVEDPIDGTAFDCDVIETLDVLKKKYLAQEQKSD